MLIVAAREPATRVGDGVRAPEGLRAIRLREDLLVAAAHVGEGVLHVVAPALGHDGRGGAQRRRQGQKGREKGPHFANSTPLTVDGRHGL